MHSTPDVAPVLRVAIRRLLLASVLSSLIFLTACSTRSTTSNSSVEPSEPQELSTAHSDSSGVPACAIGASVQHCHGWVNTNVRSGAIPFVQSMTCSYSVPDIPSAMSQGSPATALYLYCQIVANEPSDPALEKAFGQMAPQIAIGSNFDVCGQPRPTGSPRWYMQAMYFWESSTQGVCVGGTIFPVEVGAYITSVIEWDALNGWWNLSITDGVNTSVQIVKAPSDPNGTNASHRWTDFSSIRPAGSFELWNGVVRGSYPANEWQMQTSFTTLPDHPIAPASLQMIERGNNTNAMSVSCAENNRCTWLPPT